MLNSNKLEEIKNSIFKGGSTREDYWIEIENLLISLDIIANHIKLYDFKIEIFNGKLILNVPIFGKILKFVIDPKDKRSAPFVLLGYGEYELIESQLLVEFASFSSYFIDVGANVGFYSVLLKKINYELQIYSFEPNKIVFENLKENLKLNAVKNNILLFDVALSQVSNKYVNLFVPSFTGSGGGSLLNLHPEEGLSHKYTVRQMRLDDIEEIVKVDLMKIDVEGNEWNVISGSQNLIRKNRPVVFIELLRKWMKPFGHHPSDVFDYFINMGYYCFEISDSGIQKINKIDANTIGTNFVFCPIESKNKLKILNDFVLKG